MRHLDLERWARGSSPLHRWHARTKLAAAVCLILVASLTPANGWLRFALLGAMLLIAAILSRLPVGAVLRRAAIVLPFVLLFSIVSLAAGDTARAFSIPVRSYLSCLAVVLVTATTPLPSVVRALDGFGLPRPVLITVQFLYRYLFVLFEEAQAMRTAASCRGGTLSRKRPLFQAAASTLAVLFGKAYDRADGVHQAMLSRGFNGSVLTLEQPGMRASDLAVFAAVVAVLAAVAILI